MFKDYDDNSSKADSDSVCLPIDMTSSGKLFCKGCNIKPSEPSVLSSGHEGDKYGGFQPWASYSCNKEVREIISRSPQGYVCAVCRNVFTSAGWDAEHKSIGHYLSSAATPAGRAKHQEFLNKKDHWVKQHNKNVASGLPTRLKGKKELMNAGKSTLDTNDVHGRRLSKPKRQFVLLDHWDPKIDGPLDEGKVVEETIDGKLVKGIHKLIGREGVYEEEEFSELTVRHRTEHANTDIDGPFAEERLAAKKKVILDGLEQASKHRAKNAVDTKTPSDLDMLALLNAAALGHDSTQPQQAFGHGDDVNASMIEISESDDSCEGPEENSTCNYP